MSTAGDSLVSRVRSSFQRLSSRASDLNNLSDQVGKVVARFDAEFNKLNIGIVAWVPFDTWTSENGLQFTSRQVGYAKIGPKWGLAIREFSGDEGHDDYDEYQEWLFNDAPRMYRLHAIELIPELFEKLVAEVDKATQKADKKLKELNELASALDPMPVAPAPLPNTAEVFGQIGAAVAAGNDAIRRAAASAPKLGRYKR